MLLRLKIEKNKDNKPWFDQECHVLRKNYHKAKNYHWRKKNAEGRLNMIRASKIYRKGINRKFKAYQEGIVGKIRKLESTDPKLYWSILNRCENSKQKINDIAVDTLSILRT